jgi:hypothetical protein
LLGKWLRLAFSKGASGGNFSGQNFKFARFPRLTVEFAAAGLDRTEALEGSFI